MLLRFTLATFILSINVALSAAQTESLKSVARRMNGTAVMHVSLEGPLWPLDEMVRSANLIVRGRIVESITRLNEDETLVFTDHTVSPVEVLKIAPALGAAAKPGPIPIVLQQLGGTVKVDGLVLKTITDLEDPNRPLRVGEEYFFFLSATENTSMRRAKAGVYDAVTGPLGIFPIRNGKVENFSRRAAAARPLPSGGPSDFSAAIRALLAEAKK